MRSDLTHLINACAGGVYRRYRQWTEVEDIRQEMWVWAYGQDEMKLENLSTGTLKRRLWDVGLAYARREKAIRSGYGVDDEAYYSLATIRELLPQVVEGELPTLRGVDDRQPSVARRQAAGAGMELETALVDLRKAYSRLDTQERLNLYHHVRGNGHSDNDLTDATLRRMQRILGGRKPRREAA